MSDKCTHGKHEVCAECFNNLPSPADPQPASDLVEAAREWLDNSGRSLSEREYDATAL